MTTGICMSMASWSAPSGPALAARREDHCSNALEANTSYDFIYLEDNRSGGWQFNLGWKEPNGDVFAPIPSTQLSPAVDTPPVPASISAAALADATVQISWDPGDDVSSFGYAIQRAAVDPNTGQPGSFVTLATAFSGPAANGGAPAAQWGSSTFIDKNPPLGKTFVYRVAAALPAGIGPFSPATAPVTTPVSSVSAALSADGSTLNVMLNRSSDQIQVSVNTSQQLVVTASSVTVFSGLVAGIANLNISGIASQSNSVTFQSLLNLPGIISVNQVSDVTASMAISAAR